MPNETAEFSPPGFSLADLAGESHSFPTGRRALVCFVKEDCETCNTAGPVLEAFTAPMGRLWMSCWYRSRAMAARFSPGAMG